MDLRIERKNFRGLDFESNDGSPQKNMKSMNPKQNNQRPAAGSVNRNFIDSMGGIFGQSEETQQFINQRAGNANNTFPLRKSPSKSPDHFESVNQGSPIKNFREMDTDISTDYYNRNQDESF